MVEARQYTIDRKPGDNRVSMQHSTVRYTRITSDMNADKAKKTAEKFDKKIAKAREELLKNDPVEFECGRLNITAQQDAEYAKYQKQHETTEQLEANRLAHMPQPLKRKDAELSAEIREATKTGSGKTTGDVAKSDEATKELTTQSPDKK